MEGKFFLCLGICPVISSTAKETEAPDQSQDMAGKVKFNPTYYSLFALGFKRKKKQLNFRYPYALRFELSYTPVFFGVFFFS